MVCDRRGLLCVAALVVIAMASMPLLTCSKLHILCWCGVCVADSGHNECLGERIPQSVLQG